MMTINNSEGYKMASIARLTGFSPILLRAWERRYGLLKPERSSGNHRLYSQDDLKVLFQVKLLLNQNRTIGEIALTGRKRLLEQAEEVSPPPGNTPKPLRSGILRSEPINVLPQALSAELDGFKRNIIEAASRIDGPGIETGLNQVFAVAPALTVIHEVIEPCARALGELWIGGRCSVGGEHLASAIFLRHLLRLLEEGQPLEDRGSSIVCACFPDEDHQLGSLVLANSIVRRGFRVAYLGPALPLEDLELACDLLRPRAACLSVTRNVLFQTHRPKLLEVLKRRGQTVQFHLGGGGIQGRDEELEHAGARLWLHGRTASDLPDDIFRT